MNSDYLSKRILEIIPAFLTWTALLAPILLSLKAPIVVAYFVITFDLYWLFKAIIMGYHLILGFYHVKKDIAIDWLSRCKNLKRIDFYKKELEEKIDYFEKRYSSLYLKGPLVFKISEKNLVKKYQQLKSEYQEVLSNQAKKNLLKDWGDIYHVVLLATYQENLEIIRSSILTCLDANYPKEKMIFVLATEERAGTKFQKNAQILQKEFKDKFFDFLVSTHPDGLPGEIKAKGANVTWAAKKVIKPFLDEKKISYDNVIVSTFDADTRPNRQYFACVTYKYITNPNRTRRSYQPIPLYNNNIWDVPAFMRIVAFGASFWQMIESTRSYRLTNFSSHAMSFQTLVDINYWALDIVNEDSRQFWRAYFTFDGDHEVIPIFTPVYMDAVLAPGYLRTMKNQYLQKRRWAYGIEHFPYVVKNSIKNKEIPFWSKAMWVFRLIEGHFSWATASIFIATAGWMPLLLNPRFHYSILSSSIPALATRILTISWIGIITSMTISLLLLPPKPIDYKWYKKLFIATQWVLMPFSALIFGSFPAIDAQSRLALGKYLEFWVTEKVTAKKDS